MRAPPIIWDAAGRPDPRRKTAAAVGQCYWCASPIDGPACVMADVISDSFTDQDQALVRESPHLCCGCAWAMTGRPPDTLRLWSIGYREDGATWPANHPAAKDLGSRIHCQNKADPSAFRALLRDPPRDGAWICSVADSGQIHTLPFAPVNGPGARYGVRYERTTIWTTADEYRRIDDSIRALMIGGYSKQDIADEPTPSRMASAGIELWLEHRVVLNPYRGGPLLDLALFLARKETSADDTTHRTDRRAVERLGDPPDDRRDGQRVDRQHLADQLVATSSGCARDGGPVQRSLFGDVLDHGAQAPDRRVPGAKRGRAGRAGR